MSGELAKAAPGRGGSGSGPVPPSPHRAVAPEAAAAVAAQLRSSTQLESRGAGGDARKGKADDFHPLCFTREVFDQEEEFDVDTFIADCRRRVPLESVQQDLHRYAESLEGDLLELINNDYADFVNLSSNLSGIDKVIDGLRAPLQQLRKDVDAIHQSVLAVTNTLESKLGRKEELEQKKRVLELFINTDGIVCKIEKLIRANESSTVFGGSGAEEDMSAEGVERRAAAGRDTSTLIQRVANDFNLLRYYVSECDGLPLVRKLQGRIERIELTLKEGLTTQFTVGLRNRDMDIIVSCLHTFAAIDAMRRAEELFGQERVMPFISEVVTPAKLQEKSLEGIYNLVLAWAKKECGELTQLLHGSVDGFDFLGNSLFDALVDAMGSHIQSVFSTAVPSQFHSNYSCSIEFLNAFEDLYSTAEEVLQFRESRGYRAFDKKWKLSVYYGLRFQEIVKPFEASLSVAHDIPRDASHQASLPPTAELWKALRRCWAKNVFLDDLTDSFFKLSLQLVSRYATWVHEGLKQAKEPSQEEASPLTWATWITPEHYGALFFDMAGVTTTLPASYMQEVLTASPTMPRQIEDIIRAEFASFKSLESAKEELASIMCSQVKAKCITSLQPVRGIMQTYRIGKKAAPTQASYYVANVLKELRKFIDAPQLSQLPSETRLAWTMTIVESVTEKYEEWASAMVENFKKQLNYQKKISSAASGMDGFDKIKLQLKLDIAKFGEELLQLGVDLSSFGTFQKLSQCYQ